MSIRLRLTLLYSTILALTLIIFGTALYSIQAQDTLNSLKQDLILSSERLSKDALRIDSAPPPPDFTSREPPQPRSFDEFSSDPSFQSVREREIARILDASGNLIISPFGRQEDALPLSEEGLAALLNQEDWWETDFVDDEKMLIYSRPVTQNGELIYIVQVARPLTERDRSLKSLATTLSVAGALTILTAFGVGWVLSGYTLRPIHRITQTAQMIGDEHDFTRRVAYTGPQDELGRLANTFNQMLARLQEAYLNVEYSLKMQRNFVADVSHELRTPLTTIRGNLGLLRRKPPAPPEEQADILADMVDESDRLIRLVNDLLDLAQADAKRGITREPLDIQLVLDETVRQARLLDPERQITLKMSSRPSIHGNRDAFKQVMLILLDNAIKHSAGPIEVTTRPVDEQVEIRVKDHGAGVSSEILEHVFDRFYRGDDANSPGFGLGLSIAKSLVLELGGTITMESEEGKGSEVILLLPTYESMTRFV